MPQIVAVSGVTPGLGMSTLAAGLTGWLRGNGAEVDLLEEEEILTRPEFTPVARELAVTATVALDVLLDAATGYVGACADRGCDVIVSDGHFPFVQPLLSWGYNEIAIRGFLDDLGQRLDAVPLVLVYLDAPVSAALELAAEREPEGWLEWYLNGLPALTGPVDPTASTTTGDPRVRYLERQREISFSLVTAQGWPVEVLDDVHLATPQEVLQAAQEALSASLSPP